MYAGATFRTTEGHTVKRLITGFLPIISSVSAEADSPSSPPDRRSMPAWDSASGGTLPGLPAKVDAKRSLEEDRS
jgi:hypothetical protein